MGGLSVASQKLEGPFPIICGPRVAGAVEITISTTLMRSVLGGSWAFRNIKMERAETSVCLGARNDPFPAGGETKMKKETDIEMATTRSFYLGQASGLERAGGLLINHAMEHFRLKKDETANLLRDIALDVGKKAELLQKEWENKK